MDGRRQSSTAPLGITLAVVAGGADRDTTWVLLHGSDGRETDLLPFVDRADPGTARVALRGAVPTALGHAFFDRRPDGSFDDDDVVARVAPLVDAIDQGQRMIGRTEHTTVLGFSNGAVMAAALIEQHPGGFTGGVLLRLKPPFRSTTVPSGLTVPVLVVDGRHDLRRTPEDGERTAERLRQGGADVEHVVLGVGHGITEDDERVVRDWLGRTSGRVRGASSSESGSSDGR